MYIYFKGVGWGRGRVREKELKGYFLGTPRCMGVSTKGTIVLGPL